MPPETLRQLIELRQARKTYRQIAQVLRLASARSLATSSNRLAELTPALPIVRYQFDQPGELLHLDIKKLGRFWKPGHRVTGSRQRACDGAGREYVYVAIDDHSIVHSIRAEEQ